MKLVHVEYNMYHNNIDINHYNTFLLHRIIWNTQNTKIIISVANIAS